MKSERFSSVGFMSVQVAALQHRQVAGLQGADLQAPVALWHLAPVADNHEGAAGFPSPRDILPVEPSAQLFVDRLCLVHESAANRISLHVFNDILGELLFVLPVRWATRR